MDYHKGIDPYFTIIPGALKSYEKYLLKFMRPGKRTVLIAVNGETIMGVCLLEIQANPPVFKLKKIGFLEQMYVAEKYQRKGVGAALLKAAFAWFKEKGMKRVELYFLPGNPKGSNFWVKKSGFKTFRHAAYREIN